jgi:hypothetical protein
MLLTDKVADSDFVDALRSFRDVARSRGRPTEAEEYSFFVEWLTRDSKPGSANG